MGLHNWESRLRDAVIRLATFTQAILSGGNVAEVPLVSVGKSLTSWNVVPRDRIELSTPAFSGLCSAN